MMIVRTVLTPRTAPASYVLYFILFTKITSLVTVQTIKTVINIKFDIWIYYRKAKHTYSYFMDGFSKAFIYVNVMECGNLSSVVRRRWLREWRRGQRYYLQSCRDWQDSLLHRVMKRRFTLTSILLKQHWLTVRWQQFQNRLKFTGHKHLGTCNNYIGRDEIKTVPPCLFYKKLEFDIVIYYFYEIRVNELISLCEAWNCHTQYFILAIFYETNVD